LCELEVVEEHNRAYWRRHFDRVRECRKLYFDLPGHERDSLPPLFKAPLYPPWCFAIKDWIDSILGRGKLVGKSRNNSSGVSGSLK
jgi:hypothetical protein